MLVSLALLVACFWLLGRVLRGTLVGVQARWVTAGRPLAPLAPLAPFALTLRPVPAFAGEELLYAAGASRWRAAGALGTGAGRTIRLGRRHALRVDGPLLVVERRSRPAEPRVVRVAAAAAYAAAAGSAPSTRGGA